MTRPIVCGVDFSSHSERALAWARLMANRLGHPLVVVHAVEPLLADAAALTDRSDAMRAAIEPELRAFVDRVAGPDTAIEIGVGSPASVLSGAAQAHHAAQVVVGTQGLGRAGRLWFGSTTLRLLRESTIPVLGVPPGASESPAWTSLLVGTDFGEAASAALQAALDLGSRANVPVSCLHVVPTVAAHARWNDLVKEAEQSAVNRARQQLEAVSADVPAGTALTSDVRTGDAADVLIAAASAGTIIVVGLGGTAGQRPGTTAYRVLSGADAPVLGVPPVRG